ncbi:MAG TPA: hypothetical protein VFU89_01110, partial [Rhabdochlamydiaceae bacterium]|nr:hypothetical protein [Rhabdochlamydiaceae bacterium]
KQDLRDAQAKAEQETGNLQEQITKLQGTQGQHKQTLEALEAEHKTALSQQEKQSASLKEKETQLGEVRKIADEMKGQLERAKQDLRDAQAKAEKEKGALQEQITKLQGSQEQNKKNLEALEAEHKTALTKQEKQNASLKEKETQLGEVRKIADEMKGQLERAKQDLENAQATAEQEKGALQEQITKLQDDDARTERHNRMAAALKQHKDAVGTMAAEVNKAIDQDRITSLNKKLDEAQKEHQNQQQQIAKLEADLKENKDALNLGLVGFNAALVQKKQIQENAEKKVKSLETEIQKLNSQISAHEKLLALANNQLPSLQGEVLLERDKRLEAENEIKDLKSEKAALQEQITKLQDDARNELRSRMDDASKQTGAAFVTMVKGLEQTKSLNETKQKLDEAQIELCKQHEDIKKLEADLTAQRKIATEQQIHQEQIAKMEELLKKRDADLKKARAELEEESACSELVKTNYDYELQQLKDEVLSKKEAINKVQKQITQLESEKSALEAQLGAPQTTAEDKIASERLTQLQDDYNKLAEEHEIALDTLEIFQMLNQQVGEAKLETAAKGSESGKVAATELKPALASKEEELQKTVEAVEQAGAETEQEKQRASQAQSNMQETSDRLEKIRKKTAGHTETPAQQMAKEIQKLNDQVAKVNNGQIAAIHREEALQNYIFLLFVQEKNRRNEPILMEKFNPSDLSEKDKTLLEEIAAKAMQKIDPKATPAYDLQKLLESEDRNTKIKALQSVKQEHGQTATGIAKLEEKARGILKNFYVFLWGNSRSFNQKNNYKDFFFANIPSLAADLQIAKEIYEECRAYYEKTMEQNDPQLEMIEKKISQLEEDQRILEEVQRLFLVFLEKCQVV